VQLLPRYQRHSQDTRDKAERSTPPLMSALTALEHLTVDVADQQPSRPRALREISRDQAEVLRLAEAQRAYVARCRADALAATRACRIERQEAIEGWLRLIGIGLALIAFGAWLALTVTGDGHGLMSPSWLPRAFIV
jgi:hypothetical protein